MVKKKDKKIEVDFLSEIHSSKKKKRSLFGSKETKKEVDDREETLSKLKIDLDSENENKSKEIDLGLDPSLTGGSKKSKKQNESHYEVDIENENDEEDEKNEIQEDLDTEPKLTKLSEEDLFANLKNKEIKPTEEEFNIWDKVKETDPGFDFSDFTKKRKPKKSQDKESKEGSKFRKATIEKTRFETNTAGKKYVLFLGCACDSSQRGTYLATKYIFERLGVELVEPEEFSCCGATVLNDRESDLTLALNARNFAIAQKYDADIMVISSTCFRVMNDARKSMESDQGVLEDTNQVISKVGLHYRPGLKIKHISWVLSNEIESSSLKENIVKNFEGLKAAPFYGSSMRMKAEELNEKYDSPDNPSSFEDLIRLVGAEPVNYSMKQSCSGFHIYPNEPKVTYKMAGEILKDIEDNGADIIITASPFDQSILDGCQSSARSQSRVRTKFPVLSIPEFMALAMGATYKELELHHHDVSLKKFIRQYDIAKK